MNNQEKTTFITEVTDAIRESIIAKIDDGLIPYEWNGIELRQLLADETAKYVWPIGDRKRKASYRNTVIVNNL